jgi:hypothetical protein
VVKATIDQEFSARMVATGASGALAMSFNDDRIVTFALGVAGLCLGAFAGSALGLAAFGSTALVTMAVSLAGGAGGLWLGRHAAARLVAGTAPHMVIMIIAAVAAMIPVIVVLILLENWPAVFSLMVSEVMAVGVLVRVTRTARGDPA